MRIIRLILISCFAFLAPIGPSWAEAAKAKEEADSNRTIDIQSVPAPIFANGKLNNYIFLTVKLEMAKGQNVLRQREQVHFVRDALVRNLHKTSVGKAGKSDELDEALAIQIVRASAAKVFGEKAVASVSIVSAEPLRQRQAIRGAT